MANKASGSWAAFWLKRHCLYGFSCPWASRCIERIWCAMTVFGCSRCSWYNADSQFGWYIKSSSQVTITWSLNASWVWINFLCEQVNGVNLIEKRANVNFWSASGIWSRIPSFSHKMMCSGCVDWVNILRTTSPTLCNRDGIDVIDTITGIVPILGCCNPLIDLDWSTRVRASEKGISFTFMLAAPKKQALFQAAFAVKLILKLLCRPPHLVKNLSCI